ncbi:MAG TPA: RNA methyltransferase [Solirubrobacterales bacterium]|nr:RNA methyltransferase [Solirubrobacterales bacterium]
MIESPHNEKLKLVRKLRDRKHREREGLFATEGEDLLEAGLAAGAQPRFVLVAAGSGLEGEEVEPGLLTAVSSLGSGARVIAAWPVPSEARSYLTPPSGKKYDRGEWGCLYLHGIRDPGNVGTIIRTADAFIDGPVVFGPDCADAYSPKAVRASMGSVFSRPPVRAGVEATPEPRAALVAHGGEGLEALDGPTTICLGAEREGLPEEVLAACETKVTIPLRPGGAESLNVAAAAAIAAQRISSLAMREARSDA